ncbi:uncharacterized protein PHACADRAFT_25162 [Phanerochaete carnosa HHB-10118-sp]|uniref:Cation/H+ exchanger transmembrane domain-containing protein n=1 Tax=Phanerochaete carnosa (strain HHB-10118-sp) TaxID=650164 RepID=K5WIU2_PHACS|nr:uncharacterized protein PHACADRAFT_25162 [Phanerochaete carnosa HHB-10118-sp]EKM59034.1 hypothetical protein PHACADRAFT_25162 [Phanerochaete carnosa HHB-10118-sp]
MNPALLYIYSFPFFSSNSADDDSFPYREPGVIELLVLSSFLFLLNVVRVVADHFLHAGIIAEIILGMVYGEPIAGILPTDWEGTFTVLGYLGLIGIVFEGGLSTNLDLLVANLPLSVLCASIGIGFPVAFSFALLNTGYGYKSLESFAAGAALCSTSLGTTLMALSSVTGAPTSSNSASSSDKARQEKQEHAIALSSELQAKETGEASEDVPLQKSRIGTVLISSAVIDDVIGLVLSSLVPALSAIDDTRSHSNLAWKVVRPMLSSVLMATITPIVARYILRPVFRFRNLGHRWCTPRLPGKSWGSTRVLKLISGPRSNLSRWGAQHHADGAGVLIMILTVSAFAAIAFCE